jgi:hypothetical protein
MKAFILTFCFIAGLVYLSSSRFLTVHSYLRAPVSEVVRVPPEVEVVVAHYKSKDDFAALKQGLAFVLRKPHRWIVYNKNRAYDNATFSALPGGVVRNVENIGREGRTYLEHIVHHYDELAPQTVFCQENAHLVDNMIDVLRNYNEKTGYAALARFTRCNCLFTDCDVVIYGMNDISLITRNEACQGSFGTSWYGCFIASIHRIHRHPREIYVRLLELFNRVDPPSSWPKDYDASLLEMGVPKSSLKDPYFGHTFERAWGFIFECNDEMCYDT